MKFAKVFQQTLEEEQIPKDWINSAIQYKSLKKCINNVVQELKDIGLERETLHALLNYHNNPDEEQSFDSKNPSINSPRVSYEFDGDINRFTPKIVLAIESASNLPIHASFSKITIDRLKRMSQASSVDSSSISMVTPDSDVNFLDLDSSQDMKQDCRDDAFEIVKEQKQDTTTELDVYTQKRNDCQVLEIYLKSDSVFFHMLTSELMNLDLFKQEQEQALEREIEQLRDTIEKLVNPKSRKTDMYTWREIFKEYMEANIFFATLESDHGEHDIATARKKLFHFAARVAGYNNGEQLISYIQHNQTHLLADYASEDSEFALEKASTPTIEDILQAFFSMPASSKNNIAFRFPEDESQNTPKRIINNNTTTKPASKSLGPKKILGKLPLISKNTPPSSNLVRRFRNKESQEAFFQFWGLNTGLLRILQFQSINKTAITKILKKFDKQTALDSRLNFPSLIADDPFISHSLAKTMCRVITEKLIPVTPQLDDFLCPICMAVAYKPIRLDCNHVFCVKCMIQLQRSRENKCPMCRKLVVMKADEFSLDESHMKFLKLYFPKESKEKQLEMEKQIVDEQLEKLRGPNSIECIIS